MDFAVTPPTTMHVDINSCFATIEQQANPLLRGKPVAVAAYVKDYGCILAASREAKKLGVKTGMRVREGRMLAPNLVVLPPDPPKYRMVNRAMLEILQSYTAHISVESIDEMVLDLRSSPMLYTRLQHLLHQSVQHVPLNHEFNIHHSLFTIHEITLAMQEIAQDIKRRIRSEIGEWITVSCGIAPNRYLAKVASGLHKSDGLVTITQDNIIDTFASMKLTDFCGIKEGNAERLRTFGIMTPLAFFRANAKDLKRAFRSIVGYHWWLRLHGYEDGVMYKEFEKEDASSAQGSGEPKQKSFGQSYALGKPYYPNDPHLWQIMTQLTMKMGKRLRHDGFAAYGVGISLLFDGHAHWHTQEKKPAPMFTDNDFYTALRTMLAHAPMQPVKLLAVYCYMLIHDTALQPSLFSEDNRKRDITRAVDSIQDRFGDFVIYPARMARMEQKVLDRIAFGKVRGLPDVPFADPVTHELNPRG